MFKEIKIGEKVIGVFKDSTPTSLTDPEYLAWKNPSEQPLNNTSEKKPKKSKKKD